MSEPVDDRPEQWTLRLYIAGQTPRSMDAFANLRAMCEAHLAGRYQIEVIDLLEQPPGDPDRGSAATPADPQDYRRPLRYRARARWA